MSLVRISPRRWASPWADFDSVFDGLFPSFLSSPRRDGWYPAVDVRETDDAIEVSAELPGLTEKDVEVNVKDNILTITGEKTSEKVDEDEGTGYYHSERRYGKFQRALTLPNYVQPDEAKAAFKDGVLTIHLPKAEQHRARQIKVSAE